MDFLSLIPMLPELALAILCLCLLLIGVFRGDDGTEMLTGLTVLCLVTVAVMTIGSMWAANMKMLAFDGIFVSGPFTAFIKVIVLAAAAISLTISLRYMQTEGMYRIEFPVLVALATLGMMLMVSAGSLLMLYVGLELQSLALYVLAAFRRDSERSSEAGLKYFVLGALASGLLLYGISLVYGFTGSIDFAKIATALADGSASDPAIILGFLFILSAMAFKISAAPFHMWAPDVYEGAPTPVTAFFSAAPKVAALGLLLSLLYGPFAAMMDQWKPVIATLALTSVLVGAFGAIGQTNIKRLLAYSSIGHVGFVLVGIAAGSPRGTEAALTYLAFYVVMSLATFAIVLLMRRNGRMVEGIADLAGVSRTHPGLALALAILMFSMAGIPPMVGFFTKFIVLLAAVEANLVWLAVAGALASVVGAFYYIRIVKVMYFDDSAGAFDSPFEPTLSMTVVTGSVLTLAGVALIPAVGLLAHIATQSLIGP